MKRFPYQIKFILNKLCISHMRTPTPIRFENNITVDPKKIQLEIKWGAGAPFNFFSSEIEQTRTRTWAYLAKYDVFGHHWNSRGLVLHICIFDNDSNTCSTSYNNIQFYILQLHSTFYNFAYNNDSLQALLSCFASFINGQFKGVLGTLFTLIDNSLSWLNLLDCT